MAQGISKKIQYVTRLLSLSNISSVFQSLNHCNVSLYVMIMSWKKKYKYIYIYIYIYVTETVLT